MEEKEIKSARLRQYIARHRKLFIGIGLFILAALIIVFVLGRLDAKRQEAGRQDPVLDIFSSEPKRVPYEELKATEDIQILTHFPVDFGQFLGDAENVFEHSRRQKEVGGSVTTFPFFLFHNPLNKGMGGRRWEFVNPHLNIDDSFIEELGMGIDEWPSYFMADVTISIEDITVWYDRKTATWDLRRYTEVDQDIIMRHTINGEEVYLVELQPRINEYVSYETSKSWIRKAIIDEIVAEGEVQFAAGTLYGYGEASLSLNDIRVDTGPYPGVVNPFDYFVEEKQRELLELFEPWFEFYKEEGIHPFTDMTESRLWWDKPGIIEGVWMNADAPALFEADTAPWWQFIGVVGPDFITAETYWRILEHPWNIENNLIGVFIENDLPYRLYLLEGDKVSGVLMAMNPEPGHDNPNGWDPLLPDSDTNHPSRGNRSYFRFEVQAHEDMWQDQLKIDRFDSEEAARAGFTDNAMTYYRGFDPRDIYYD